MPKLMVGGGVRVSEDKWNRIFREEKRNAVKEGLLKKNDK